MKWWRASKGLVKEGQTFLCSPFGKSGDLFWTVNAWTAKNTWCIKLLYQYDQHLKFVESVMWLCSTETPTFFYIPHFPLAVTGGPWVTEWIRFNSCTKDPSSVLLSGCPLSSVPIRPLAQPPPWQMLGTLHRWLEDTSKKLLSKHSLRFLVPGINFSLKNQNRSDHVTVPFYWVD